ncbi:MAG TPA: nucleotide exchange factor GrpE [Gemmataceae bacterium]|jgi:molecular chaperone GrpE|nr:nucleotide exchange factor GrpE [Gemmataceae bacterium]
MNDNAPETDTTTTADDPAARLATVERDLDETVALLKRTQADFQNYQARNARERETDRKYAVSGLAHDLLAALDNLDRAVEAAKQAGGDNPLIQGVIATQAQLLQILARHGITPIDAQPGQPFDPTRHEAVMQQPSPDHPSGRILQVLQQGFQIYDRILRPTSVIVSQ